MRTSRLPMLAITVVAMFAAASVAGADTIRGRSVPRYVPLDQVRVLARQVDDTAARLSNAVTARQGHPVFGAVATTRAFRELAWRADAFHRSVARFTPAPRLVEADYRALMDAYDGARSSVRFARLHPLQQRELTRLGRMIDDLTDAYRPMRARLDLDRRDAGRDRDRDQDRDRPRAGR